MKRVQLVLEAYTPEKYEMGLLEYIFWEKKIQVFAGFKDDHHKGLHLGSFSNRSIVKPCLISNDDKIGIGDMAYHIPTKDIFRCDEFWKSEKYKEDDLFGKKKGYPVHQKDCRKVIATPEEIGWFVTEHLRDLRTEKRAEYIQSILDNAGKCFIKMEENIIPARKSEREIYSTVIEQIRNEIEKPLLIDKKVVIYLKEEL